MPTLLEAEAEPGAKRAASEPARANKPGKRLKGATRRRRRGSSAACRS